MGMALDPKQVERELRQDWRERALKSEAEVERLTATNNDLRSIPWPRAYVMERASEWTRLLREVNGYIKTCRGSCGSDMSGRNHAIAASDALIAMLAEATAASASGDESKRSETKSVSGEGGR